MFTATLKGKILEFREAYVKNKKGEPVFDRASFDISDGAYGSQYAVVITNIESYRDTLALAYEHNDTVEVVCSIARPIKDSKVDDRYVKTKKVPRFPYSNELRILSVRVVG